MRPIDQLSLAVFLCTLLLVLMFSLHTASCQSGMAQESPQQGQQQNPTPSLIQRAPQVSQAGLCCFLMRHFNQKAPHDCFVPKL